MLNTVIKPGRSTLVFGDMGIKGNNFKARVGYFEYGLRDRLSDRLFSSRNSFPRRLGAYLHPQRTILEAFSQSLTAPAFFDWEMLPSPVDDSGEKFYRTNSRPRFHLTTPPAAVTNLGLGRP